MSGRGLFVALVSRHLGEANERGGCVARLIVDDDGSASRVVRDVCASSLRVRARPSPDSVAFPRKAGKGQTECITARFRDSDALQELHLTERRRPRELIGSVRLEIAVEDLRPRLRALT